MTRSVFGAVALFAAVLFLTGCNSPPPIVPAEGVVTLNDQPLANAQVQFIPMAQGLGAEYIATGTTDEKGRFTLTCKGGQPGACACDNRITVTDASPPEKARGQSGEAQAEMSRYYASLKNRPIPSDYETAAKSPLVIKVTSQQAEYKLELKR